MFFSIAACTISEKSVPNSSKTEPRPVHIAAGVADILTAVALFAVGICATQWHFMPVELQYAFIGAGSAYGICLGSFAGLIIKLMVTPKTLC